MLIQKNLPRDALSEIFAFMERDERKELCFVSRNAACAIVPRVNIERQKLRDTLPTYLESFGEKRDGLYRRRDELTRESLQTLSDIKNQFEELREPEEIASRLRSRDVSTTPEIRQLLQEMAEREERMEQLSQKSTQLQLELIHQAPVDEPNVDLSSGADTIQTRFAILEMSEHIHLMHGESLVLSELALEGGEQNLAKAKLQDLVAINLQSAHPVSAKAEIDFRRSLYDRFTRMNSTYLVMTKVFFAKMDVEEELLNLYRGLNERLCVAATGEEGEDNTPAEGTFEEGAEEEHH